MAAITLLTRIEATLARAAADLDALGRRWALVGGFAVSARTEPRFTRDADLAVRVTDDRDAEALVLALQDRGYRVLSAVEQEATFPALLMDVDSTAASGSGPFRAPAHRARRSPSCRPATGT